MSRFVQRVKNIFRKDKKSSRLPPGSYPRPPHNEPMMATVTKPTYASDDDDYNDDSESYNSYNVPEQTRARDNTGAGPTRNPAMNANPIGLNSAFQSNPLNPPTPFSNLAPAQRGDPKPQSSPGGFPPVLNSNPLAPNNNPSMTPGGVPPILNLNSSAPANDSSSPLRGFPFGLNPNPSAPNNNPSMTPGDAPPSLNPNPSAPTNNSSSPLRGFPFGLNPNPPTSGGVQPGATPNQQSDAPPVNKPPAGLAALFQGMGGNPPNNSHPTQTTNQAPSNSLGNNPQNNADHAHSHHRKPLVHRRSSRSYSSDDNVSRLELDYPIENVLIDGNIPSSMAIKVNEAVEHDRLGRAYHVHRYTFEPPLQRISVGEKEHIDRHLVENNNQSGRRHIREIHDNNQKPLVYDIGDSTYSHKHLPRRRSFSEVELNQYLDQIIQRPGSFVVHAQNTDDLQEKINQYIYNNNQILSPQLPILPTQYNMNTATEPVFYYTARALTNDPMRYY